MDLFSFTAHFDSQEAGSLQFNEQRGKIGLVYLSIE